MAETTVYIVMGRCGEYSDHREWPVRAFLNEHEAADLVVKATACARELGSSHYSTWADERRNAFDPNMQIDYTGTDYYVMDVPLVGVAETVESIIAQEVERVRAIKLENL